jgi:putative transposase
MREQGCVCRCVSEPKPSWESREVGFGTIPPVFRCLREHMMRDIVIDAPRMAWFERHTSNQAGLILRSDRGIQYASHDFRDGLKEYGITASMSRRGDCWNNACSETLFGSLKVERLYAQRFGTRRQAKNEVVAWLRLCNRFRMHSMLAYVRPVQFEKDWLAAQPMQANS